MINSIRTIEVKTKRNCLKCGRRTVSFTIKIYNGTRLIRKKVGVRLCVSCRKSNTRKGKAHGKQKTIVGEEY